MADSYDLILKGGTVVNQDGEVVLTMEGASFFGRRTPAAPT